MVLQKKPLSVKPEFRPGGTRQYRQELSHAGPFVSPSNGKVFSASGEGGRGIIDAYCTNNIITAKINNLALKLPREPVSGLLGIKPFATNEKVGEGTREEG
jgi:hypothetical protein